MADMTVGSIYEQLSNPVAMNDIGLCKNLMAKVMMLSADQSIDLSSIMPVTVKLLAHSDLLIKKTACHFLCTQSGCQSEQMIMAINTLLKDFSESNPMIRGLALRTMCTVQHEAFVEHRLSCVLKVWTTTVLMSEEQL